VPGKISAMKISGTILKGVYCASHHIRKYMKHLVFLLILIIAVLIAGCTTAAPSTGTTTTPVTPDLTGNWTGSMTGYINGTGNVAYPPGSMTVTIRNQTGRVFSGTMVFTENTGPAEIKKFAGVIGRDGKTLTIANEGGGYDTGSIISRDELEFVYTYDGEPFIITIDSLKRF